MPEPGMSRQTADQNTQSAMEQRTEKRFRVQFPVDFSLENKKGASRGTVYNLSTGGCKVTSDIPLPPGLYLKLCLHLPAQPPLIVQLATVRWRMEGDFGVAFLYLQPEEQKRLLQFISNLDASALE